MTSQSEIVLTLSAVTALQSAIPHPEAAALPREYMSAAGLRVSPAGRTLDSICITDGCR